MYLRLLRLAFIRWWPRTSLPCLRTLLVGRSLKNILTMFVRLLSKLGISKSWLECIHLFLYHSSYRPVVFCLISDYLVTSTSVDGPGPSLDDDINHLSWCLKRVVAANVSGCTLLPQTLSSCRHIVQKTVQSPQHSQYEFRCFRLFFFCLFVFSCCCCLPKSRSIASYCVGFQ